MQQQSDYQLNGLVALVTGAGRGLGASIAEHLAANGAAVAISDRDGDAVQQQAERLTSLGYNVHSYQHDVCNESQWQDVIGAVVANMGGYDILVNNAGIEDICLLENTSLETFKRIQDVNVNGSFLGLKHSIAAMKPGGAAGKGGSIINLSSVAGMSGFTGISSYCAAKGGVRLLTKAAARECGELGYGIRVNSVHPGFVHTEMGNNLLEGYVRLGLAESIEQSTELFKSMHPLGFGQPKDIGNLVSFLASPASAWITGSEHVIDGGWKS